MVRELALGDSESRRTNGAFSTVVPTARKHVDPFAPAPVKNRCRASRFTPFCDLRAGEVDAEDKGIWMVETEIPYLSTSRVSRFAQPCMLGIVRSSGIRDSLPQASPTRIRLLRHAEAAAVRPAPVAWSGGRSELGHGYGYGLVACLEPSRRPWLGAAIWRREWMSDTPRVAEDLIAARPGQKLSILCLDSWHSRRRTSADDSVRNMTIQPSLDHPSQFPCEAFGSRQGTMALEDHLKWIGTRANTEVSA